METKGCKKGAVILCILLVAFSYQILRRWVRMTPFWRTVGSKPYGAYCQNDYECTTKLCRKGHCAYHVSFES
ncbi:liver-expressed antimicrobial peptide 2 [Latimeria chalumnae]|uniref:liver-expressed antimicrobial peptide 2 n=1 Tax=Latimeria chalumnae TaxID=7897 RepID=UPI00313CC7CD